MIDAFETFHTIAFVIVWAAAIYRTWSLIRTAREPRVWALWASINSLALALTVLHPGIYRGFDRLAGVPNMAAPVGHSLLLICYWQLQAFLLYLTCPVRAAHRRVLSRGVFVLATVTLAGIWFYLASVDVDEPPFTKRYADTPYVAHYLVTLVAAFTVIIIGIVRPMNRYAKLTCREHLRFGLQLVALSGLLAIGYWWYCLVDVLLRASHLAMPDALGRVGAMVGNAAAALCAIGITYPAWGPRTRLRTPTAWWRDYCDYRRLYLLWRDLAGADREVILHAAPRSWLVDVLLIRKLSYRLARRVVEIEDALQALQPYRDPALAPQRPLDGPAAGHDGQDRDTAAEARAIAHALRARAAGAPPCEQAAPHAAADESEYAARLDWLLRVARAYSQQHARLSRRPTGRTTKPSEEKSSTNA